MVYQNCKLPLTLISGGIFWEYTYKPLFIYYIHTAICMQQQNTAVQLAPGHSATMQINAVLSNVYCVMSLGLGVGIYMLIHILVGSKVKAHSNTRLSQGAVWRSSSLRHLFLKILHNMHSTASRCCY